MVRSVGPLRSNVALLALLLAPQLSKAASLAASETLTSLSPPPWAELPAALNPMPVLADYVPPTTLPPAPLDGVFCRGSACQYRVAPPPVTTGAPTPLPGSMGWGGMGFGGAGGAYGAGGAGGLGFGAGAGGGGMSAGMVRAALGDACRGLGCPPAPIGQLAAPGSDDNDGWMPACIHLIVDIAGGLKGTQDAHTALDIRDTFVAACVKRVGVLEVGACSAYADVFVAGVAPFIDMAGWANPMSVCDSTRNFIKTAKQAEVDLRLVKSALHKKQILLSDGAGRTSSSAGPDSLRSKHWRDRATELYALTPLPQPLPEAVQMHVAGEKDKHANCGGDRPCDEDKAQSVPQEDTMYQIAPGSPNGAVPPTEISGDLFLHCRSTMSEIMLSGDHPPATVAKMTQDWCNWQVVMGSSQVEGRGDWTRDTCQGLLQFMLYTLRDGLQSQGTISAAVVCKKMFLATGAIHRSNVLIANSWTPSLRGVPIMRQPEPAPDDDPELQLLVQASSEREENAKAEFKMRKEAEENARQADAALADLRKGQGILGLKQVPPPLPSSADFDPMRPPQVLRLPLLRRLRVMGVSPAKGRGMV